MTKPTKKRWVCPEGEHPGVLAPARLRRLDVRRYCLPCSEARGVLVERTCPAVERERERRGQNRARRAKRPTAKEKRFAAARARIQRRYEREHAAGVYVPSHFQAMLELPVISRALETLERPRPIVEVRRRRVGTHTTGRAWHGSGRVVLTIPERCTWGQLATIVAHEIAHVCVADEEHHGPAWRSMFLAILAEGYGLRTSWPAREGRPVPYDDAHADFESMLDSGLGYPASSA